MPLSLSSPVNKIPLIGPSYAKKLAKLNIYTTKDLLFHYPSYHKDLTKLTPINQIKIRDIVNLKVTVNSIQNVFTKNNKKLQIAQVSDNSGQLQVIWFNQLYLPKTLKPNTSVYLSGKINWFNRKPTLIAPEYELDNQKNNIHVGRIIPIYPTTYGLSSKWLRSRIFTLINQIEKLKLKEYLPQSIITTNQLIDLQQALKSLHFPDNQTQLRKALNRLKFDELFLLHLKSLVSKQAWQQQKTISLSVDNKQLDSLIKALPFTLTNSQNKVLKSILKDLQAKKPMNRLLQGEVGSGKTIIAALAISIATQNKLQAIFMAPTQILAKQHYQYLKNIFKSKKTKIALITSHTKSTSKADILIGTQALLHRSAIIKKAGLIVIDEQHRFGVFQRSKLLKLNQIHTPHLLTMTATPIPRTIALTAYADLDLSIIDQLPFEKKKTKTWVVPEVKRTSAYQWIKDQIKNNQAQVFVVCPLINPSEAEKMTQVKAVTQEFKTLKTIFSNFKLELLHGQIKTDDKNKIIKNFSLGKSDILVSTPVVEVGIDIQNASIIVIEDAERFGLSTLHQLRGRVGRRGQDSYCLLFTHQKNPDSISRLNHLTTTHSGLKLAELDLKLRGPGNLYGSSQHGFFHTKLASFTDEKLVKKTQKAAQIVINQLTPGLKQALKPSTIPAVTPN